MPSRSHEPFDAIVVRLYPEMLRFAKRLLRGVGMDDPAYAGEDALAGALLRFWREEREGRFETPMMADDRRTRLLRLIRCEILNARRRWQAAKRGRCRTGAEAGDPDDACSKHPSPEEALSANELVESFLRRLRSPEMRAIFSMLVAGCQPPEIAGCLNIPIRTAERRLRELRDFLERSNG